jgi:hypothetical protein
VTLNQLNKKSAQAIIADAMKIFRGPSYVKQSKKMIGTNAYDKLTNEQLDQGVVALVLHCNLTGGSVSDMNLYKLLRTYLQSSDARTEINGVVGRYGL